MIYTLQNGIWLKYMVIANNKGIHKRGKFFIWIFTTFINDSSWLIFYSLTASKSVQKFQFSPEKNDEIWQVFHPPSILSLHFIYCSCFSRFWSFFRFSTDFPIFGFLCIVGAKEGKTFLGNTSAILKGFIVKVLEHRKSSHSDHPLYHIC